MQKIVPHLWFNTEATQAAEFYTAVFPNSKITSATVLRNTPSGDCDVLSFEIMGYSFMAISAGPLFTFNPSISFMLNFDPAQNSDAIAQMDAAWDKLADGGKVLMPLSEYPFSSRYGWVQDKYGVSWQLILTDPTGKPRPAIIPSLLFVGDVCGKAAEAADFYLSVFTNTQRGITALYGSEDAPDKEGDVMFSDILLEGQWFALMDSARMHDFTFNEAISLIVQCKDQAEIDYYWNKLSAVPEAEQCGWLKDKYGVSWQVVPQDMNTYMSNGTPEQIERVTQAFLPMKKFDLAVLKKAYEGK
jgi:predicted 3-demethylubiquinone-9 3-methyltransferase (glyoxalase superfamily)